MNEQQQKAYEDMIREAQLQTEQQKIQNFQTEVMLEPQEKSMIKEQLDLGEELTRIDYLLRGFTLKIDPKTKEEVWVAPDNQEMVIFSDYGVHLIRNTIAWYLNKNTLLSNYDDETIRNKMEDFSSDLNDTIFMEYDKVFQYPTLDDCKKELDARIKWKKDLAKYTIELLGTKVSVEKEKEIEKDIVSKMEPIIEKELEKIKSQLMKNKLKRFLLIMRVIQDAVHSTYLRALKGQERTTLRQHIHISENKGGVPQMQGRSMNPLSWMGRG